MKIKEVKKGEFFTRKPIENPTESQVWVKGEYDRSLKAFECYKFSDVNTCAYIKATKEVYTEFTF